MRKEQDWEKRRLLAERLLDGIPDAYLAEAEAFDGVSFHANAGFLPFLAEIFHCEGRDILSGQFGMLILLCTALAGLEDTARLLPLCAPLFVLAAFPSLFRPERCGTGEMEAVTKHSNVELLLAKLLLVASADLFCFTGLLWTQRGSMPEAGDLRHLILYLLVPYLYCLTALLYLVRRHGGHGRIRFLWAVGLASTVIGTAGFCLPELYRQTATGFWYLALAVFATLLLREIRESLKLIWEGKPYGVIA